MTTEPPRPRPGRSRVLVVCYGNICRSPIAEALLKRELQKVGLEKQFVVRSAGVGALEGNAAAPRTQHVARTHGLDLSGHRSRRLTPAMARDADLLIALDEIVEEEIAILAGDVPVELWPVDDPYQGPDEGYARAYDEIAAHVRRFVGERARARAR
jgi:protein-tyrosine phosphatase